MAVAPNNLKDNSSSENNRVVAFFSHRNDAYQALSALKNAGFDVNAIGLAVGKDQEDTSASSSTSTMGKDDTSFWQKVKDFFSGENDESEHSPGFHDATGGMGWSNDRSSYYREGISAGGAVVTVTGDRIQEARLILQQHGGDLRENGFERSQTTRSTMAQPGTTGRESGSNENTDVDERRIQLRGEMLRTYKDRVQRGEVRLRKEVVTESKTVDVPVSHEELVIERTPSSGQVARGEIGTDEEIRVPLSEERVRVEKQPVVNEEVRVGKRQVQGSKQISDQVRREELRVEKEGDVESESSENRERRKNPAA